MNEDKPKWKQHPLYDSFKNWMIDEFEGDSRRLETLLRAIDNIVDIASQAASAEQRERDAEIAKEFHCDYRKCPQVIALKILNSNP